jgi:hypothetical protein
MIHAVIIVLACVLASAASQNMTIPFNFPLFKQV